MRHHFGDRYEVRSAGTEATFVKPEVLVVLGEAGVSTDGLTSKTIDHLGDWRAEIVVTVCDDAKEQCPFHPGLKETIHQGFADPSNETSSPEARTQAFRNTRDEIEAWLKARFAPSADA